MEGEQESGQETSEEAAAIVQLETVDAQTIHGGGGEVTISQETNHYSDCKE